jgi:hypothetical protein
VLLDPFEEEFHLPSTPIQGRNVLGRQLKIIGQENESALGFFGVIGYSPDRLRLRACSISARNNSETGHPNLLAILNVRLFV